MKRKSLKADVRPFSEVEAEWYGKLYDHGFRDIENTSSPDRPLNEWHDRKFRTERSIARREAQDRYQRVLDNFINSPAFGEICSLIVKHGNSALTPSEVRRVIKLHRDGLTERKIATKVKVGKKCIHLTIIRARTWIKLAS